MNKFPKQGTSIVLKKALGALLILSGFVAMTRPNIVTEFWLWDIILALLLFAGAFFLLIAGRQK